MSEEQFQDMAAREASERYEREDAFYKTLKKIMPEWLREQLERRWEPNGVSMTMPYLDPMQGFAEIFSRAIEGHFPENSKQMRDMLIVYAHMATRQYQQIANSYAKIANDALRTSYPPPFEAAPPVKEGTR